MQVTRSQLQEMGKFVKSRRGRYLVDPITLEPTNLHAGTTILMRDAAGNELIVHEQGKPVPCPPGQWVTDPR